MACQKCGDEVWSDGNTWRHDDEDEKGLDDDHEGEPSDEDEEQDNRDRWESEMESRREQKELGHPKMSMFRSAAINFLAGQNVTDREELLFRAHRHASNLTGQLPVPVAQRVVQGFVAAVLREADSCCPKDNDEKDEKKAKESSRRTAAVVANFPDELMF